jgi:DNA-binding NarL/FixJ family response regulator
VVHTVLVGGNALFREMTAHVLSGEEGIVVAAVCNTFDRALPIVGNISPDVVLLNFDANGLYVRNFIRSLRQRNYDGAVLIIAAAISDTDLRECMEEGATGIFLKQQSLPALVAAVSAVAEGRTWLDERQWRLVLEPGNSGESASFAARELQILHGIVDGLSNKELAARLDVPVTTIKAGVQRLFNKTGVRTRACLVRIALEQHPHLLKQEAPALAMAHAG